MESTDASTQQHGSEAGLKEPLLDQPAEANEEEQQVRENETQEMHYEFESPSRPWWQGNLNLYLGICYIYVLWFIFRRGTWRFTLPINALSAIHVITAGSYGIVCCMNVFHTPGHGPTYRRIHMNLGRFGMAAGLVSIVTGMTILYAFENPLGLRIGLTYAGIAQFGSQVMGMYELFKPKRNLTRHASYMRQSLLFCCFIPAIMRLPDLTGVDLGVNWNAIAWVVSIPLFMLNERAEKNKRFY